MAEIRYSPGLIISSFLLFFVFLSLMGFLASIRPPKILSSITPGDLGLAYEDISFTTKDGLRLRGWFIPSMAEYAETVILLHGYPADKGNILPILAFLSREYNLLLFDFRYLGKSEGKISTAGAKETEDLLAAIRFLKARGIEGVGVWGFSLGGAVALMTAKQAPEIRVIISESSYARMDLMARELYRIPLLKYPLAYLTGLLAKIFLGIDLRDVSPAESAKGLDIPILLVHSKNDRVIPFEHAVLLQEALKNNPNAEFWFEDNLAHGQLGGEYQKRILEFFSRGSLGKRNQ